MEGPYLKGNKLAWYTMFLISPIFLSLSAIPCAISSSVWKNALACTFPGGMVARITVALIHPPSPGCRVPIIPRYLFGAVSYAAIMTHCI